MKYSISQFSEEHGWVEQCQCDSRDNADAICDALRSFYRGIKFQVQPIK